ncbi:MAG TPA: SDR family oxidoreductase [Myxococcota bacterium]|nr:SDR family oxidoreductase [Myxococcota bacterium]
MSTSGTVVLTGASTGIGRAAALHLDREGFRVFAGVRREADGESLRKEGSERLEPLLLDVTDAAAIAAAAKRVEAEVREAGLSGLVNNAGIGLGAPVEFLDLDELRRQFEVNVVSVVAVTKAFLPAIRRARGRIVNVGSIGGRVSQPLVAPYNASKFALEALSESERMELAPWGIQVSLIEPGAIDTAIWGKTESYAASMLAGLPRDATELYGDAIRAVLAMMEQQKRVAIPPAAVARAIHHALTAARPKARYLVGTDAKVQALLARWLPDRWRDAIIVRFMKYPRSHSASKPIP